MTTTGTPTTQVGNGTAHKLSEHHGTGYNWLHGSLRRQTQTTPW